MLLVGAPCNENNQVLNFMVTRGKLKDMKLRDIFEEIQVTLPSCAQVGLIIKEILIAYAIITHQEAHKFV